ncbi:YncE family protein [Hahella sp. KA22]|uniref:YncE family protein n=1 Tax=Hahella sp. KA22 TaxID=1628392 RepID=UPI000FDD0903|nr:YncE family protein [Hahella sp. KA22]AZZ92724.1 YncE family protein [Hahella sp. KA22]QAY56098.1 YncE family protein [Hahella sp. KA22]
MRKNKTGLVRAVNAKGNSRGSGLKRRFKKLALSVTAIALALGVSGVARAEAPAAASEMRDVLLVGNAQSGTVSFIDPYTFLNLGSVNVTEDKEERISEMGILKLLYDAFINENGGERNVDDVFLSPDGTVLYVSRGYLGDVAAFDLTAPGHRMLWRHPAPGFHADHAALSPDGGTLVVSDSTSKKAFLIDAVTGRRTGEFATGDFPHQNDFSPDGKRIYNTSIGNVLLPHALNFMKGERSLRIVDAESLQLLRTIKFPQGVRPNVFTPDEKTLYAQLSYLRGFVKVDLEQGAITHTVEMPASEFGKANYPNYDDFPKNSAHHGLALSGDGKKLCLAGTIDNYVAIISTETLATDRIMDGYDLPYWATTSSDGSYCFVSNSVEGTVGVFDYDTTQEAARIPVGEFPQRSRMGKAPQSVLNSLDPVQG